MDLYTGFKVVENFQFLKELYYDGRISLDCFGHDIEAAGGNLYHLGYYPNTCLLLKDNAGNSGLGIVKGNDIVALTDKYTPSGIRGKNVHQTFALSLLNDPDLDLVTISGKAGSGKTLLALAHATQMSKRNDDINKIVIAKSIVPVGREIGYLKGDFLDKIRPWLGGFIDNFEILGYTDTQIDALISDPNVIKKSGFKIEVSPITYIQGRSISNAVMIIDEAQNLPRDVIKQILSRPADNTKVILMGDTQQVFERGLTSENNGFAWVIERGKEQSFVGHIDLPQVVRSRLAAWIVEQD